VLDKITSGFHRGELSIIGARPAVGKSALGMHIALATAAQGYRVGVVSREMTDVQYGARILGSRAEIEPGKMRTGQLDPYDWTQLSEAMQHYSDMSVSFMFSARDIEDLRMEVQRKIDGEGLDMLVIDYLQLLQTRRRFEKDYLRVGYISKAIKDMTTDFNIPIIALAQVGRSSARTMPNLSELRGSGDIEQDADNVIFMHRPEDASDDSILSGDGGMIAALEAENKQYIVLEIAKQRQGQTGRTAVVFDPARMKYTSIAR
jgi:replicative DNA helicase